MAEDGFAIWLRYVTNVRVSKIKWRINWRQVLVGILALGLGVALYVLDRPPAQTYFVPNALSLFEEAASVFGTIGYHLPTFLHVFAFCLITSGVLGCGRRGAAMVCLLWLLIDGAFELGQHPDAARIILPLIPGWFANIPVLDNTANYFSQGHFDPADVISILLGTVGAYLAIWALPMKQDAILNPQIKN